MNKETLPKGCFNFINHKRILRSDINRTRPTDQHSISCEQAIRHGTIVKKRRRLFGKTYWVALSTTTYEMSGDNYGPYLGGRAWAETDETGLEWHFHTEEDAARFRLKDG